MTEYWPNDLIDDSIKPPISILRDVATELNQKTGGLLTASITDPDNQTRSLLYRFYVIAPALNDFSCEIFRMRSEMSLYPVTLGSDFLQNSREAIICDNESELIGEIRRILSLPNVKKTISALVAQSKVQ